MSITVTFTAIAASLVVGTIIGKHEQDKRGIRPMASEDIDDCVTVYADEPRCECIMERETYLKNGTPCCADCGGRIW